MKIENTPGLWMNDDHRYFKNGEEFTSVSLITKHTDSDNGGLMQWTRNTAAKRFADALAQGLSVDDARKHARREDTAAADFGTKVHAIIENTIESREVVDGKAGALAATAVDWFWSHGFKHPNNEVMLCDAPIAGTIDCVAEAMDGGVVLLDWKTSGRIYPGYIAQLGGYQRLLEAHKIARVAYAGVIRIDKKSGCVEERWVDMAEARRLFDLCLEVHLAAGDLLQRRNGG